MVNILSERIIQTGREIVEKLDNMNLSITSALWLYSAEANQWRLVLVSPLVRQKGPRHLYKFVQSCLLKFSDRLISLSDITVLDDRNNMINILKGAIKTGKTLSSIRFTHNYVNGVLIEDAYIYRIT